MDDLPNRAVSMQPVAPVSPRSDWNVGIPIAGTVGGLAAAADSLTPDAIYNAAVADTGGTLIASLKAIQVPPNCTYMEIGASGDGAAITTAPVLEFWRCNSPQASPVAQAIAAAAKLWKRLYNVLGNAQCTLSTTVIDATAVAGAARYQLDEGTYQNGVFDVRGARVVLVKVITIGTSGNWSLNYRFF
jgi:hypothetical protein